MKYAERGGAFAPTWVVPQDESLVPNWDGAFLFYPGIRRSESGISDFTFLERFSEIATKEQIR